MGDAEAVAVPVEEAEAPAEAEAPTKGAQTAQEAAPAGEAQGGGIQGEVVMVLHPENPTVITGLKSADGKMVATRESLAGMPEAQMVWDFAMRQYALALSTKAVFKRFVRDMELMREQPRRTLGGGGGGGGGDGGDGGGDGANGHHHADEDDPPQPHAHAPIRDAFNIPGEYVPYGDERWQRKRIGQKSILKTLTSSRFAIEIVEDVRDGDGRPYVIGNTSHATHCGAFPHALVKHKTGPYKGKEIYVCSGRLDIVITIRLVNNQLPVTDPNRYKVTERDVLKELERMDDDEQSKGWGAYERALTFYVELQFCLPRGSDQTRYVCADIRNEQSYAFKKQPPDGKLFSPAEVRPYGRGPQEIVMIDGKAEVQFSFNENVHSMNLIECHKKTLFCITAHCLNPYLNGRPSFSAMSSPFLIKKTLHNDLSRNERWVRDNHGATIEPHVTCVTRMAPARKLAFAKERKMAEDKDVDESGE
jgi:hypothetical protein